MRRADFHYELPEGLIAQAPVDPRSASRLLVMDGSRGSVRDTGFDRLADLLQPEDLLVLATTIFNFALGFSCWHTLWLNKILLPKELRPNWFVSICLLLSGAFFWMVATVSALQKMGML